MNSVSNSHPCRAVIVTALPVEFNAVCEHLTDRFEETHPQGTVYERGYFRPLESGEWEIIVAEIGAGNVAAAAEVERVISHCRPNVVLFVGVAGGIKDVSIGDVVAGSKVYGYESGKESDSFKPRPMVHESNYRLVQRAKAEARSGRWRQRIQGGKPPTPPRALIGPIAAGEKVVADSKSATAQLITLVYGDTLAVEMEGYGFLHGAYLHQHLAALVIRGISDLLDGKAKADGSGSQEFASKNASAFCFEILARLGNCPGESEQKPDPEPSGTIALTDIQKTLSAYESRFQIIEKSIGIRAIADIDGEGIIDSRFSAEMDSARELLKSGHANAARLLLKRLQATTGENADVDKLLRFRLETNLGAAALVLGEYQVAEPHFEFALALKPGDPKALSNRALIALMQNQTTLALEYATKAWSIAPGEPQVASIYLQALDASGNTEEARRIAREHVWIQTDSRCALVLALIEFNAGDYTAAEKFGRTSLEAEPTDAQAMELIARCIIVPLRIELSQNPPLPGKLPPDVAKRATEAETLFVSAVSILEHQDHKQLLIAAVANRGVARSILGQIDDALSDYDRVLRLDPQQNLVRVNKARLLLGNGSPHEALQLLESVESTTEAESWHPLVVAYLATGQPKKALALLLPKWGSNLDNQPRVRIAELLLQAYSDLGDSSSGETIAESLQIEFPADAEAITAIAEWRASQAGGFEQALSLFFRALDVASDDRQKDRITLSLAGLYYKNQRFLESADLYGKLSGAFDHPVIFRRYLLSLYYGGLHSEALGVAAKRRAGGRAIPIVSAIESHLLEETGDLAVAESLLAELVGIEPDNPEHRIYLAYLRYRRGDLEGSKQAVLGVDIEEIKGSAHQLLALAKVRAWLNLDGVLELAYRARRIGFDDANVHQGYISLFLNRKRDQDVNFEVAKTVPGTTVHLQAEDGNTRVFTIVDGLDADLYRGELLPSDPVALALLGRVTNEYITLKQTEFETVSFRITKLQSQYVFAFQETLVNFSTWFPNHRNGPEKIVMDDGGINKMLGVVGRRHTHVSSVLELYRASRITLGMLAQLIGRSVIEIWSGLQGEGEAGILASTGQDEAYPLELASSQEIVIELSALLTLASLNLLSALKERFSRILSTQFVFDEVSDELTLERAGLRNAGTIYLKGDHYVMDDSLENGSAEKRLFLENVLEFLKRDVTLLPAPGLLNLPSDQKNAIGRSALTSILLARSQGAILCSDDLLLRTLARNDWGVLGTWSQKIIFELRRSGAISDDDYHRAAMSLVQRNYTFVGVNEKDYVWLLRAEGMLTARFVNALRALHGPDCTEDSAVIVAGAFLRDICLEPEFRRTRYLLIDAIIGALKHGRQPVIVLSKLEAHLHRLMVMNPEGWASIRQAIALWKREPELLDERAWIRSRSKSNPERHNH